MSKTLLRFVTVALLALSIPVQGMASIVAGQCMTFGHHEAGEAEGHVHVAATGGDHADHSQHSDDHADEGVTASHCGPCTACCASASIAAGSRIDIPASPTYASYVFAQFPPLGVQPDGLYRPPLSI